jgi:hypothetical protein
MDPNLHSSHRIHSKPQAAGPSRFGDKRFEHHQPRSLAMTQLPSVTKLNDFKRRVTPRKMSINNDPGLCRAHLSGIVDPTVESLTLSDERSGSWET